MTVPGNLSSPLLATAADADAAAVATKSLRFNAGDSAYLSKTFSSAGTQTTWTWSSWVKRTTLGTHVLFQGGNSDFNDDSIRFDGSDRLSLSIHNGSNALVAQLISTRVFRDFSAWYHIQVTYDSSNSTASDRIRFYVNGSRLTDFDTSTYPSQNVVSHDINDAAVHYIGTFRTTTHFLNAYLADIHFVDGLALEPTSFGAYDDNGVWQAAEYSGTFGTNGFHLKFDDNSTNSALGTDSSGNDNDFTTNNLIADTGKVFTSAKIYSTFSGERAANYKVEYSDNNSTWTEAFSGVMSNNASFGIQTGTGAGDGSYGFHKYWRYVVGSVVTSHHPRVSRIILSDGEDDITIQTYTTDNNSDQGGIPAEDDTFTYTDATAASNIDSLFDVPTNGDSSDDTGAGGEVSGNYPTLNPLQKSSGSTLSNGNLDISMTSAQGTTFATMAFPASGKWYFECTANASQCDVGIAKADADLSQYVGKNSSGYGYYVDGKVYHNDASVGTGATYTTGDVIGVAFDADAGTVKWYKNNSLQVTVSSLSGEWFPAFGSGNAAGIFNFGSRPFAYSAPSNHKALCTTNLPTPTIADGSAHFDIKLWTGNGGSKRIGGSTTAASSGVTATGTGGVSGISSDYPITGAFDGATSTYLATNAANISSTAAVLTVTFPSGNQPSYSSSVVLEVWAGTADTVKVAINGGSYQTVSASSSTWQSHTVASGSGTITEIKVSRQKSNTNNGAAEIRAIIVDGVQLLDGNADNLSFQPDWVWVKHRNTSGNHNLFDSVRGTGKVLFSNNNNVEGGTTGDLLRSFNSDGFTVNTSYQGGFGGSTNNNNDTYAGWAWNAGANSNKTYTVKVVSDSGNKYRFDDFGTSAVTLDLEEGSTYVFDQSDSSNSGHPLRFSTTSDGTHNSGSEYTTGVTTTGTPGSAGAKTTIVVGSGVATLYYYCSSHSGMGGQANTNSTAGSSNFDGSIQTTVKANPTAGFSIATYSGSGSSGDSLGHGLNAEPEFVIVKARTKTDDFRVYHKGAGTGYYLRLNGDHARTSGGNWQSVTSTTLALDSDSAVNSSSYTYLALFFAPVAGFSAVGGPYTGTGTTSGLFQYCGFRPRWIMIKSSVNGSTGNGNDWTIFDTVRAPYNETDAFLEANTSNAEYTGGNDQIDILSNGFKPRQGNTQTNHQSNEYIWIAFAENPFSANGGLAR